MKITLAITGSIAAYKSHDLVRNLVKAGHEVQVILTKGALEFIQPNTLRYLGAKNVFLPSDDFNPKIYEQMTSNVLHIEIAKQTEAFVVVPMSANSLARLARGEAGDLMTSVYLALSPAIPKVFFPAMNPLMLTHTLVQANLARIQSVPNTFIHPTQSGEMICGDEGDGKLAKVDEIQELIETLSFKNNKKKVLITAGATLAPLDPVRYLTNPSSGLTGYHLSKKYLQEGYKVHCIAGTLSTEKLELLAAHPDFKLTRLTTTAEFQVVIENEFPHCDIYISSAALCDFDFNFETNKIKKNNLNGTFEFKLAPDILAQMLSRKSHQKLVGFAAETPGDQEIFLKKWRAKPVDLLVGNFVNSGIKGERKGFVENENEYYFIKDGQLNSQNHFNKQELADFIFSRIN